MKEKLKKFCVLMAIISFQLIGENLIDVVEEAGLFIERAYKTEFARQMAKDKLKDILLDEQKTDRQKIEEIQQVFLQLKKDEEDKKNEEITEANAHLLIWTPPLSWDIHSIAIAYDVERSRTHIISAETLDSKKTSRTELNEKGGKSVSEINASGGTSMGGGVSWTGWLQVKPQFEAEAHASFKADWDKSKNDLWSKQRQEQLANSFEELTKDIQNTQKSKCHLTFAIDFHNNYDDDLVFPANSTVPVFMGRKLVLEAMPDNLGNTPIFSIPRGVSARTIKFRGEISTTEAFKLLEFMKENAPSILLERGNLVIKSLNGKVNHAIHESLSASMPLSIVHCGAYEWKVRNLWNDKPVTVREALWAVNSLYEKAPFNLEGDSCISVMGISCGPNEGMAEADAYPIVEIDGHFFSHLGKSQLDEKLLGNGIQFHLNSLEKYIESESYTSDFCRVLLEDLLIVADKYSDGHLQFLLGRMFFEGRGTSVDTVKALECYHKAAGQGYTKAQYMLGESYEKGKGVTKDIQKAVELYCKAAEQGDAMAQCSLGRCYYYGYGMKQDKIEAVKWFRRAAEQKIANAWHYLGVCYFNGDGVKLDKEEAVKWFRRAAEQGIADAQYYLGLAYFIGDGVPQNQTKTVEWHHKAAEQGHAAAQYFLGKCYANGEGVQKDMIEAVEWWQKAAEQGYADAQYFLGDCYEKGNGIEKDMFMAVEWWQKAAEQGDAKAQYKLANCDERTIILYRPAIQGNAKAQYELGICYENGKGVEKNIVKAVEWYHKAAEQGYAEAQCKLGVCYDLGKGVKRDWSKAAEWYSKASEQGNSKAQFNLGINYEFGHGVEMNKKKAVELYRKAAKQGYDNAIKRLKELEIE